MLLLPRRTRSRETPRNRPGLSRKSAARLAAKIGDFHNPVLSAVQAPLEAYPPRPNLTGEFRRDLRDSPVESPTFVKLALVPAVRNQLDRPVTERDVDNLDCAHLQ